MTDDELTRLFESLRFGCDGLRASCPKEAVVAVTFDCSVHGSTSTQLLCQDHYQQLPLLFRIFKRSSGLAQPCEYRMLANVPLS